MDDPSNVTAFPARAAPATSGWTLPVSLPSDEQVVALLTSCLALVRPVGLSDSNARDWLMVAAGEVSHIHADLLTDACAEARRTCTHHGQIVPKIIKETEERMDARRREQQAREALEREERNRREQAALPKPDPWHPTDEEIEQIKAEAAERLKAGA